MQLRYGAFIYEGVARDAKLADYKLISRVKTLLSGE
jgi:hypothetical protein